MKVFLSYRREDSRWPTQQLAKAITQKARNAKVFMDIDSIPVGVNFAEVITREVQQCDLILVVIGSNWLSASTDDGQSRRLDRIDDFVRIEIKAALERGIPVVPILIDGAKMPKKQVLPSDISELAMRNAEFVQLRTFDHDVSRLLGRLGLIEQPVRTFEIIKSINDFGRNRVILVGAFLGSFVLLAVLWSMNGLVTESASSEASPSRAAGVEPNITDEATLTVMQRCDELASHHLDRTKPGKIQGKTISEVRQNPLIAQEACIAAVIAVPHSPRMNFNLSRAYYAGSQPAKGMSYAKTAADLGSLRAQMSLGLRYVDGEGQLVQDFAIAREHFEAAEFQGEPTARAALGRFATYGIGEPVDLRKAYEIGLQAAEEGYNRSQYNTGVRLANGIGVEKNEELARTYFAYSILNPSITPIGHTQLGWMSERGIGGVPINHERAIRYYEDGRRYTHRLASLALAKYHITGKHVPQNVDLGIRLLEEAVRKEFYSLQADAYWTYEQNPHFEQLVRSAIQELKLVASQIDNEKLDQLLIELWEAYETRQIPIHEQVLCSDKDDKASIPWCVGYWNDKPVQPIP